MYKSAVYILNRMPTEALQWKTPYEVVWGRQPLVAHIANPVAYARGVDCSLNPNALRAKVLVWTEVEIGSARRSNLLLAECLGRGDINWGNAGEGDPKSEGRKAGGAIRVLF